MSNTAYDQLLDHVKTTRALGQVAGLISWDQEVMMPANGAAARAEQAAALEEVSHQRRSDPKIADWLAALNGAELNAKQAANVRLIRRSYDRTCKIPPSLATELARTTSTAQGVWAKARAANRFEDFSPILAQIIELKRQEAACLTSDSDRANSAYDALLDDFEPGMRVALPNARIMIHQPSGGARGMASDIEIQAREILRIKARMNDLYVTYTGKSLKEIEEAMDRDTFLEADEAKKFGLVDKVFETRPESGDEGEEEKGSGGAPE